MAAARRLRRDRWHGRPLSDLGHDRQQLVDAMRAGVLFMGVLCRLRYPLLALALDIIRDHAVNDMVASFPLAHFVEQKCAGDPTNWWIPNASALAAMLRSAGITILERPEEEVFVGRVAPVTHLQREPAGVPSL